MGFEFLYRCDACGETEQVDFEYAKRDDHPEGWYRLSTANSLNDFCSLRCVASWATEEGPKGGWRRPPEPADGVTG